MDSSIQNIQGLAGKSQVKEIVTTLVAFINGQDTDITNAYKALVGELGNKSEAEGTEGQEGYKAAVSHTVKTYVDAAIAAVNSDNTALAERVSANETAIGKKAVAAQGTEGEDGYKAAEAATGLYKYVDDAAAEAVTKVLDGAPEAFDTLKEIATWIGSGDVQNTTAATMLADLSTLKGTGDGSVSKAVADAKSEILGDAATDTKDSKTIEGVLKYADDKVAASIGTQYVDGETPTAATGIYDKIQGATTKTVKDCVDAISGFALMTDEDVAEIKALIK